MLHHYYDVLKKDSFDALFGNLYVGKHPMPERNSYLVLHLNFSGIDSGLEGYQDGLDGHCWNCFNFFCDDISRAN